MVVVAAMLAKTWFSSTAYDTTFQFLLFQEIAVQSTILCLFHIIDMILQTISVVKESAAAAATIQEYMAVSYRFELCL